MNTLTFFTSSKLPLLFILSPVVETFICIIIPNLVIKKNSYCGIRCSKKSLFVVLFSGFRYVLFRAQP